MKVLTALICVFITLHSIAQNDSIPEMKIIKTESFTIGDELAKIDGRKKIGNLLYSYYNLDSGSGWNRNVVYFNKGKKYQGEKILISSQDGNLLAIGLPDRIEVWDSEGNVLKRLHKNGQQIKSISNKGVIKIYDWKEKNILYIK